MLKRAPSGSRSVLNAVAAKVERLGREAVAKGLGVSEGYLQRALKAAEGKASNFFRTRGKLDKWKGRLREATDRRIREIKKEIKDQPRPGPRPGPIETPAQPGPIETPKPPPTPKSYTIPEGEDGAGARVHPLGSLNRIPSSWQSRRIYQTLEEAIDEYGMIGGIAYFEFAEVVTPDGLRGWVPYYNPGKDPKPRKSRKKTKQ